MLKRILHSQALQWILGCLVAAYMVLVKYTTRWEVIGQSNIDPIIKAGTGAIVLTWHSRFMMLNSIQQGQPQKPHVLISQSRDGALIAYTAECLGLGTIRGSSRKVGSKKYKGGSKAFMNMIAVLEGNDVVVITPDGPRGPRQRVGDGPARLSKLTGCPIITCTFSVTNRKQFKSWDRFVLPFPFGRGQIIWGQPCYVEPDAAQHDLESIRQAVETEMNTFLAQADRAMGHDRVDPV